MTQLNPDPQKSKSLDLLRKEVDRLGQQLGGGADAPLLPLPPTAVLLLLLVPHPALLLLITGHLRPQAR